MNAEAEAEQHPVTGVWPAATDQPGEADGGRAPACDQRDPAAAECEGDIGKDHSDRDQQLTHRRCQRKSAEAARADDDVGGCQRPEPELGERLTGGVLESDTPYDSHETRAENRCRSACAKQSLLARAGLGRDRGR